MGGLHTAAGQFLVEVEHPVAQSRVEYALTPLGGSLHDIVTSLITWAADHYHQIREHRTRTAAVNDPDV